MFSARSFIMGLMGLCLLGAAAAGAAEDGLVVKASPHSVAVTLDRLKAVLEDKGLTVFAHVDHAAAATKAALELPPTQLLVFGNPKAGTPLMQADQRIGLDLPLKALAWQDADGKTWLGYWAPDALKNRYGVKGRDEAFANMAKALDSMTDAAVKAD